MKDGLTPHIFPSDFYLTFINHRTTAVLSPSHKEHLMGYAITLNALLRHLIVIPYYVWKIQ